MRLSPSLFNPRGLSYVSRLSGGPEDGPKKVKKQKKDKPEDNMQEQGEGKSGFGARLRNFFGKKGKKDPESLPQSNESDVRPSVDSQWRQLQWDRNVKKRSLSNLEARDWDDLEKRYWDDLELDTRDYNDLDDHR